MTHPHPAHFQLTEDLAHAGTEAEVFTALYRLSDALIPVRLWTVMTVDLEEGIARRAFSNMPEAYPTSGTKPITTNSWFDHVHGQRQTFVANTLPEIAAVFPDHELIGSLGCASVMNLPLFDNGTLLATVNLLDAEGHFTEARVAQYSDVLSAPALAAARKARSL